MSSGVTIAGETANGRRWMLELAALAAGLYVLLLIVTPLVEPEFDLWRSHPEDYAAGHYGALVNISYATMAVALVALAGALFPKSGWNAVALALFVPPALLCVALTADPIGVARQATVASLAILALAVAPIAVSIAYRRPFGRAGVGILALAILVAIAFVALAAAPASSGGAVNRVFDVLAGTWIIAAAVSALRARGGVTRHAGDVRSA